MRTKGGKICVSRRSMNRLFHRTHALWQVLRNEGADILVEAPGGTMKLDKGSQPTTPVIGVEFSDGSRFTLPQRKGGVKFTTSVAIHGETFRVHEAKVPGLPTLIVDPREG